MTIDAEPPIRTLERWVAEHQPTVFRAAYLVLRDRDSAEDVAQETFLRAHRAARRPTAQAEERPWLYRIAVNLAINHIRSAKRERAALERALPNDEPVDDLAERRATRTTVAGALAELPDRLRVPVVLRYYLDMSERDIAHALKVRPGTVKSRLHEARRVLAGDEAIVAANGSR